MVPQSLGSSLLPSGVVCDQPPPPHQGGYRLMVEGRFTAFPDGRAIRCRASSVDQRPICIAAVQLDRVAFEDTDGSVLSDWRTG